MSPLPEGDPLSLWRTVAPRDATARDVIRLSTVLVARGRACETAAALEDRLVLAEGRDPMAWLALADTLPYAITDPDAENAALDEVEGSCLWLASRFGSRWARLALVLLLVSTSESTDAAVRLALAARLAERLPLSNGDPVRACEELGVMPLLRQSLEAETPRSARAAPPPEPPKPEPKAVEPPSPPPTGPSLRVLLAPPLPAVDRDTKALIAAYEPLAQPVALAPAPNPDMVRDALLAEFPWLSDLAAHLHGELLLARRLGQPHVHLPPLLIHGPSGCGKSRFLERLSTLLGIPAGKIFAAGSSDNRALAGTARGWSSAQPCLPLTVMRQYGVANPIIIVEEIDKVTASRRNGRLTDTLLTMLDPVLARAWPDECLLVAADLSQVTWILTANRLDLVPAALRARCRLVHAVPPRPEDFDVLFRGALHDVAREFGADPLLLPVLAPEAVAAMRRGFAQGHLQARQLAALVRRGLVAAAQAEEAIAKH